MKKKPTSTAEVTAGQIVPPATGTASSSAPVVAVAVTPTQVRRPWRSTVRTIFQAALAFALLWPVVVTTLGLPEWSWVGVSIAAAGGFARVMALPGVETFLRRFVPWLAAAPDPKQPGA